MFVTQGLQLAGGHHELVRHSAQMIVVQYIAEYLEVFGFVHPRVLTDFIEIREYAPLSGLVGDERHTHRVDFRSEVGHALGCTAPPFVQPAHTGFHMVHAFRLPSPTASDRRAGVHMTTVRLLPIVHEIAHPSHPVARRFVAAGHHAKRSIIAIRLVHALRFFHQITVDIHSVPQLHPVVRPARSFGLQIESHTVGRRKGGFGRTERMETHVVQPIAPANAEHPFP